MDTKFDDEPTTFKVEAGFDDVGAEIIAKPIRIIY